MKKNLNSNTLSRRNFFKVGGFAVAGSTLSLPKGMKKNQDTEAKIRKYRRLGRTGFMASDIGWGSAPNNSNVIRYAYDKGVNYFDSAEVYGNGEGERLIGEAMPHMDRKKIWITTKIHFNMEETEEKILDRFSKCQERLKTDYVDAFYIHAADSVEKLSHKGFHSAIAKLKAKGRVRHAGVSCHGPEGDEGDSMEKILTVAAEDGRFDLMLLVYNFMNKDAAEKVIAACKKNDVGVTIMKTSPGILKVDTFDPENPTEDQSQYIDRLVSRGRSKEEAFDRIKGMIAEQREDYEKTIPFAEKYKIKTDSQLRLASLQWVLSNPDICTVCMRIKDFDGVDMILPMSGTKLSRANHRFLHDFEYAFSSRYCRHGCRDCMDRCPHKLPVSTIMRYSYYFVMQGREKESMIKYAGLNGHDASFCFNCDAPCKRGCPYGVSIQANLVNAHSLLTV